MKCPFCHQTDSKVTDSRDAIEMNAIRRRRECLKCNNRFTTFETIDVTIQVKKRDGTYEDFQQEKLLKGLEAACTHSRISHDEVKTLVSKITNELLNKQIRIIDSRELGELVIKYLQKLDTVAYIRFACVYKRFKDIEDLMGEIKSLVPMKGELKKPQLSKKGK
jgi:transcriptional repressor NrdR